MAALPIDRQKRMQIQWIKDQNLWNGYLQTFPMAHVLQTWEWGEFKSRTTGWTPRRCLYLTDSGQPFAAASLLSRRIGPLQVIYITKGPIFADIQPILVGQVLDHLEKLARGTIWLKIDPDIVLATGVPSGIPNPVGQSITKLLETRGWRFSADQVQFRNTLTLDLTQSEEALLAGMNQSTRRKIRQAEKAGVLIREARESEWHTLYNLYAITGERQNFTIRPWEYYQELWLSFKAANLVQFLVAVYEEQILSGVVLFHFGQRVWYFYGMSSNDHRDLQPNYLLQWAAIRWAKEMGYQLYDWWGAPNEFAEDDPMWGVYRFKQGFGSQVIRTIGAWDYVPYPFLYWMYVQAVPRFIAWLRRRKQVEAV